LDAAGNAHDIGSADVNEYLRAASGGEFTAKDFRTWHASVLALQWRAELDTIDAPTRARGSSATLVLAEVAARLGNTVAVCRRSYVHPRVLELLCTPAQARGPTEPGPPRKKGLSCAERKLLALLRASA
ncbi:MAG TPA: DNA topoisomerase IB, partial [Burkholderiaceae bacterium]|nr:DNA topoisomerase IB [Burkholderiaceae bacterium]